MFLIFYYINNILIENHWNCDEIALSAFVKTFLVTIQLAIYFNCYTYSRKEAEYKLLQLFAIILTSHLNISDIVIKSINNLQAFSHKL